jgi:ABC-type antimicrobial peptide transport system permease subunit
LIPYSFNIFSNIHKKTIMIQNYLKIALRNLQRNKVYSFINIGGLALSMACGIIIFTLVKHHLSFDDFHTDADRIYRIVTEQHRDNISYVNSVPAPLGKVFREDYMFGEKVARLAVYTDQLITIKGIGEIKKIKEAEGLAFAEPEYFDIFNYPLIQGDKKTALVQPNTAIVTEKIAKKYFGTENPIGKEFFLGNKIAFTITGILKDLPENTDIKTEIYVSYPTLKSVDAWLGSDNSWGGIRDGMFCFVRLKPNVSIAEVEAVLPAYVKKYRPTSKNVHHYKLQPLKEIHFDARYGGAMEKKNLWVLALIGVFLIITACVNFINLATAQALKRAKEVGLRKVLGGVRSQLFWRFLAETAMITSFGAVVAIVLALGVLPEINQLFAIQMSINLFTDKYLAFFVFLLVAVVTFLAGAYPGLVLAGFQPVLALKGKLSQQNVGGFNTRRSLIIAQFAISQVLIIGVIVIMSQMRYAKQSDLGFDKEAIVMVPIGADSTGVVMHTLKNQFSQILGVEKVSLCRAAPASPNTWNNSIRFDNQSEEVNFRTNMKAADEDYVSTFGLELVAGKNISPSDTVRGFIVNEAFMRKLNFQSPEEIIGKMIAANGGRMVAPIVGVVKDFHEFSFHEEIGAVALMTDKRNYSNYAVKMNLKEAKNILASIEKAWTARHPDQIFEYQFLDESIARFYQTEETLFKQIQILSFIAIFIGCLGLYGLVLFMANQKSKEIGIRKVLGGSIAQILWIFGKEFALLILIAFFIAAPIGWWLMNHWLQDFKYHIEMSASIFILSIATTFVIALITVSWQSIKAAMMNPVKSLRSE